MEQSETRGRWDLTVQGGSEQLLWPLPGGGRLCLYEIKCLATVEVEGPPPPRMQAGMAEWPEHFRVYL